MSSENENGVVMNKSFFRAMLQGLVEAAEPEEVIERIVDHIHEYGHQRFLEGMDFQHEIIELDEENWLEYMDQKEIETCSR